MNKDIYRLMNNVSIEEDRYEDSELTQKEKDMIFRIVTNTKGSEKTMKKSAIMKTVAGVAAVAAAFTFVISNSAKPETDISNDIPVVSDDNSISEHSTEKEKNIVSESAKNSFVLRVSADSVDDLNFNNSDIIIKKGDYGVNNFLGLDFEVSGENISEVLVSVTGGSLCKVIKTVSSEPANFGNEEKYVHQFSETTHDKITFNSYEMTYAGSEISEKYDGNNKYGFCVSGERYEEITDSIGLVKEVQYACIDEFNDQTLTVAVKYTDGTEETKKYILRTGRLKVDTSEEGIGDEQSSLKFLPEFTDGEGTPWIYGVIASLVEE